MMTDGMQASGHPCPECGCDRAWIEAWNDTNRLTLRCQGCGTQHTHDPLEEMVP